MTCELPSVRLVAISLVVVGGCGSARPPAYSAGYKEGFEARHKADEGKARAFVSSLAGVPADQRKAYLRQHWADAKNLALIPDQDLQAKYKSLMQSQR